MAAMVLSKPKCCGARWHPEVAEHAGRWSFPFQLLAQLALEVALLARQAGLPAKLAFGQERGSRGRDVREGRPAMGRAERVGLSIMATVSWVI
jgi:hypothetical protein